MADRHQQAHSSGDDNTIHVIIDHIDRSNNHYETLGVVAKEADEKVLKKSYRRLALRLHPDKCKVDGAEEAFKKVSHAYATLSNPDSRAHYDRFGNDDINNGFGGGGQDPAEELFRDFMAQNPDFAAAFAAGAAVAGGGPTMHGGGGPRVEMNLNTFNFSAATLAGCKSWWESQVNQLPNSVLLRGSFRFLGWIIFALLAAFLKTMPYSGLVACALAMYLGAQIVWWLLNRSIWLMAFHQFPNSLRWPQRFWFAVPMAILLVGEKYYDFEFDLPRGVIVYVTFSLLNYLIPGSSSASQQHQQPTRGSSFSSFSFSFPPGGSPGFVQVGSSTSMGGNGNGVGSRRVKEDK